MTSALIIFAIAALSVEQVRAQQVILATTSVPFYLPTSLQGAIPPTAVTQVGTPSASALATTYSVAWAPLAGSTGLTVQSNPTTLIATQTAANINGVPGSTTFNCDIQTLPLPGQAVCTIVDPALVISYVETEALSYFSTVPVVVSTTTVRPSSTVAVVPTTSAAVITSTAAPSSAAVSPSVSTPSIVNTEQSKSANVFQPGNKGAASGRWAASLPAVLATLTVGVAAAAFLL